MRADKDKVLLLLKTARGQIDGLIKMVEDNRYCIDISNQLMATEAILKTADKEIIGTHIRGCVKDSFESNDEADKEEKINEVLSLINKLSK